MRIRFIAVILVLLMALAVGCKKNNTELEEPVIPAFTTKYTVVTETDMNCTYTTPVFKNMSNKEIQQQLNEKITELITRNQIIIRKSEAVGLISDTDLSKYSFSEMGTFKVHCNDGKYLSFSVGMEQRFADDEKSEFVKKNYLFNIDAVTGKKVDIAALFNDKERAADYIAHKFYDRMLNMGCLETEEYSDRVFKNDIFDYCAIVVPNKKVAVVTTAGKFGLKLSAGAPIVEISIPEEYYIQSK